MTLLYLVRHGETDWNRDRRIQGSTDIPLNETGRLQARRTGTLLARRSWDAIITSPLSRAAETAAIIADELGLPAPQIVDAIVERAYGEAEGLDDIELARRFPDNTPVAGRESRQEVGAAPATGGARRPRPATEFPANSSRRPETAFPAFAVREIRPEQSAMRPARSAGRARLPGLPG